MKRLASLSQRGMAALRGEGVPWRYYVGYALIRASSLVLVPITAQFTGAVGLGRFEVAVAVVTVPMIVVDAGVAAGLVRFGSAKDGAVAAAVDLQIAFCALGAVLLGPLVLLLGPRSPSAIVVIAVGVLFVFVEGFAVLAGGLLRAEGHDRLYLRVAALRMIITIGVGLVGVIVAGVAGALFAFATGGVPFAVVVLRRRRRCGPRSTLMVRRLLRYGVPLIATTVSTWSLALSDRLFLRDAVTPRELGGYAANYRLGSIMLTFMAAPMALAWLQVARRSSPAERRATLRRWAVAYSAACATAGLALVAAAPGLLPVIFGGEFVADRLIVGAIAASGWLGGLYYLVATPLLLGESTKMLAAVSLPVAAVNLALNALLIPTFDTRGAAAATVVSYALLCLAAALPTVVSVARTRK